MSSDKLNEEPVPEPSIYGDGFPNYFSKPLNINKMFAFSKEGPKLGQKMYNEKQQVSLKLDFDLRNVKELFPEFNRLYKVVEKMFSDFEVDIYIDSKKRPLVYDSFFEEKSKKSKKSLVFLLISHNYLTLNNRVNDLSLNDSIDISYGFMREQQVVGIENKLIEKRDGENIFLITDKKGESMVNLSDKKSNNESSNDEIYKDVNSFYVNIMTRDSFDEKIREQRRPKNLHAPKFDPSKVRDAFGEYDFLKENKSIDYSQN